MAPPKESRPRGDSTLRSRRWTFLALALFLAARLPFLVDDPAPELVSYYQDAAMSVFDEGWWTLNARHLALSGHVLGTGFDLCWVSPFFTACAALAFEIGGVGYASARLVTIVAGFLAVALLASLDRRRGGGAREASGGAPTPGEWAAIFCAGSFAIAQLGRLATPEWVGILCGVAGVAALLRKDARGNATAGACAVLAALTKPHFAFLGPAFLASALVLARRDGRRLLPTALAAAAGAAIPALAWAAVVLAHAEEALGLMSFYRTDRWFAGAVEGAGLVALVKPGAQLLLSGVIYRHLLFAYLPALFVLAALALPSVVGAMFRPRRAALLSDAALVFGIWAIFGGAAISSIPYQPLRYYLPLIPALAYLAGWSLVARWHGEGGARSGAAAEHGEGGARSEEAEREGRLEWAARGVVGAFVAIQAAFAAAAPFAIPALAARSAAGRVELLNPPEFSITAFLIEVARSRSLDAFAAMPRELALVAATASVAVAAVAAGTLFAVLARRLLARPPRFPASPRAIAVLLAGAAALDASYWVRWIPERARTLPDMSRDLGARFDGEDVLISPAGTYSLGNGLRYDSRVIRDYRLFDGAGEATHFVVLEDHPLTGHLPEGTIERTYPGAKRLASYTLTGDYVYSLYARAPAPAAPPGDRAFRVSRPRSIRRSSGRRRPLRTSP